VGEGGEKLSEKKKRREVQPTIRGKKGESNSRKDEGINFFYRERRTGVGGERGEVSLTLGQDVLPLGLLYKGEGEISLQGKGQGEN